MMTTSQVARLLNASSVTVLRRIADHSLQAVDITPKGKRRTWRIHPDALLDFEHRNAHTPEPMVEKRRKQIKAVREAMVFIS